MKFCVATDVRKICRFFERNSSLNMKQHGGYAKKNIYIYVAFCLTAITNELLELGT
jgi:hypothetical protein